MLDDILKKIRAPRDHEPTVISLGQVWVDLMMDVPAVPAAGQFATASAATKQVGGAFQVLNAASRMGARAQLASILGHGAETHGSMETFDDLRPRKDDIAHIGGNALMNEGSIAVAAFLARPECQATQRDFRLVLNPTNTLDRVNDQLLENLVIARPLWSMNRQEGRTLADRLAIAVDSSHEQKLNGGFDESMHALCEALSEALRAPVILRGGSRGAWLKHRGAAVEHIDGFPTKATHSRSAGPVHTGALCALLAEGWDLSCAAQIANAAASLAIAHNRNGVPFCPTYDEAYALVEDALKAPKE